MKAYSKKHGKGWALKLAEVIHGRIPRSDFAHYFYMNVIYLLSLK